MHIRNCNINVSFRLFCNIPDSVEINAVRNGGLFRTALKSTLSGIGGLGSGCGNSLTRLTKKPRRPATHVYCVGKFMCIRMLCIRAYADHATLRNISNSLTHSIGPTVHCVVDLQLTYLCTIPIEFIAASRFAYAYGCCITLWNVCVPHIQYYIVCALCTWRFKITFPPELLPIFWGSALPDFPSTPSLTSQQKIGSRDARDVTPLF